MLKIVILNTLYISFNGCKTIGMEPLYYNYDRLCPRLKRRPKSRHRSYSISEDDRRGRWPS